MTQIIGMTHENPRQRPWTCAKCAWPLRNDHGWVLSDGTAICKAGDKCSMRVSSAAARGKPKRWRP